VAGFVTKFALVIEDGLRKRLPDFVAHGLARKFASRFFEFSPELLVIFFPPRKPDDCDSGWEIAIGGKIVKRRNKFAISKIAGSAEDYNRARLWHCAGGNTFAKGIQFRLISGSIHKQSAN
jgi:hypothetical protein